MRQVTVASYAVGTHTAAGGLDRRLHSQDRQQACSVLTVPWTFTPPPARCKNPASLAHLFPSRGWKRVPTVPDDQADSRWLSQQTTTTKTRRTEVPGRPHLISHGAAHYLCKVQPPKGSKARVNGRLQLGLEDENSCGIPCRARSARRVCKERTTKLEGSGRAREWNGSSREGIHHFEAP